MNNYALASIALIGILLSVLGALCLTEPLNSHTKPIGGILFTILIASICGTLSLSIWYIPLLWPALPLSPFLCWLVGAGGGCFVGIFFLKRGAEQPWLGSLFDKRWWWLLRIIEMDIVLDVFTLVSITHGVFVHDPFYTSIGKDILYLVAGTIFFSLGGLLIELIYWIKRRLLSITKASVILLGLITAFMGFAIAALPPLLVLLNVPAH